MKLTKLAAAVLIAGTSVSFALAAAEPVQIAQTTAMTTGEVRKVDRDQGKVTIKHGPLTNLDMPAMTMVFRVKDPTMLDKLKEGDKINFAADKVNGAITVMQLEPAK